MDSSELRFSTYYGNKQNVGKNEAKTSDTKSKMSDPGSVLNVKSKRKDAVTTPSYDCLACILRPILCMGMIIGVSPLTPTCTHNNKGLNQCKFQSSNWCLVVSLLLSTLVLSVFSFNMYCLAIGSVPNTKDKVIQFGILVLLEMGTIVLYLCSMFQINQYVKEMNGLVAIITNKDYYFIDTVFDAKVIKYFKRLSIVYIVVTVILVIVHVIHIFIYLNVLDFMVMRGISSCVTLCSELVFIFQFSTKIHIYKYLLAQCYAKLKAGLQENLTDTSEHWAERSERLQMDRVQLTTLISRLHKMNVAILLNLYKLNSFLNPLLLLTIALTVLVLILSYYLLIYMWMLGDYRNNIYYYMMEFKTLATIVSVAYLLRMADTLSNPGNDILPFLEGYPLSKLRPLETLQVEMFVTTLRVLPPQLTASRLFNIGIGLIASILGTIVSYVLVALQFHASWLDED